MTNNMVISQLLPRAKINTQQWPAVPKNLKLPANLSKDLSTLPKITIITPPLNQDHFITDTIRSILLHNYPILEYQIINGGSTDNTIEIIKKYSPWFTGLVSKSDSGQSHAINKGFENPQGIF